VAQERACDVTTPLKGATDKGGGESGGPPDSKASKTQTGQVILRLSATRKIDRDTRLVLLRGYIRSAHSGKLERMEVRVMVDTGAQADFISPALVQKLGGKIEHGRFGIALEAFGAETPLTRMLRAATLGLPGVHASSLLAHDFAAERDFILAPVELSSDYDILLGQGFNRRHLRLLDNRSDCVKLTLRADDGAETTVSEIGARDDSERGWKIPEQQEQERESAGPVMRVQALRCPRPRPLLGRERRAARAECVAEQQDRAKLAARAAAELPEMVLTYEGLQRLWNESAEGTAKMFPIFLRRGGQSGGPPELTRPTQSESGGPPKTTQSTQSGGPPKCQQGKDAGQQQVRIVAAVSMAQVAAEQADSQQGLLPVSERATAEQMVQRVLARHKAVFPDELPKLPAEARAEELRCPINLKEGTVPFGRYGVRMTQEHTVAAEKMLKELLAKGFIRPSRSPWGSPMFLVAKPDGGLRMVIDYRALNKATVRNRYPLPRVDELFDQLQGARYFSKLDLRTGYWQIRMAEEDIAKTAFTSRHGHFEWTVMPMGLTNAPAEFMALMENTFREELNKFVLVFLDDILIYSRSLEEHEQHLNVVLERLGTAKLYGKLSKCQFARAEVEFLGHYVGRSGVRMVDGKVAAVQNWPTPRTQKDVEQFIGLAGYYRRFIDGFSRLATPLTELCGTLTKAKGGAVRKPPQKQFVWGDAQAEAFERLKAAVTEAPCLALPDSERDFIVHTDASGYATGAVLMQRFDEGLRPIAFLSRRMKPAERNYPVHEQELLAILNAMKAWRHYLGGRPFTVLTDHQSLQYVDTSAMATPRQIRWASMFAEFDFTIQYAPGPKNVAADALSRSAAGGPEQAEDNTIVVGAVMVESLPEGPKLLLAAIGDMAPLPVRVKEAARRDEAYQLMLHRPARELERDHRIGHGGLLYRVRDGEQDGQLVVPHDVRLRAYLISAAHDALQAAHRGGDRTLHWLQERVWWPKMSEDVAKYVAGCEQCQRNKPDLAGKQGLPLSVEVPRRAWQVLCMDFIGPLPRTARGHNAAMVVVDKLTRYAIYVPCSTTSTAQEVFALFMARVLGEHGIPEKIISDRDTRFTSRFWEGIWEQMGAELKRSTAFHPQSDGQTENQNRTLIQALRSYVDANQSDWDLLLPWMQFAHNTSECASTGFTPDYMVHGQHARTLLDAALEADGVAARSTYPGARELARRIRAAAETARAVTEKAQEKQRRDATAGRREVQVQAGDKVWLSNRNMLMNTAGRARKLEALFYGPYVIKAMHGPNAAELLLPAGCRLHPVFNTDLLRKHVDGKIEFPERPQRDARPGPVPEEDPAAGGPAAGEPTYEVEAVTGKRTSRRGRIEYRLRWRGWPEEQSSWVAEEECGDCGELVADYEQLLLDRRRAVGSVLTMLTGRLHERWQRVEKWRRVAALRQQQLSEAEQRAQRESAIVAATSNEPVTADRPQPDKHGQIAMGSQRCTANNRTGKQCASRTLHGQYCWVHRAQLDGTRIKASSVPGAGKGLWAATRDFGPGDIIARYTGDLVPTVAGGRADGFGGSHYVLELSDAVSIDAARTNTADGRMVNDARGSGQRPNCRFSVNQRAKTATLRAVRRIAKGAEILVSYGRQFWHRAGGESVKESRSARKRGVPSQAGDSAQQPIVLSNIRRIGTGEVEELGSKGGICNRIVPVA
jgi:hypothetical protein